jgi:azurin
MKMNMKATCAAALWLVLLGSASAATCDVEIEGNDAMQFNKSSIDVPQSCKQFTVKLKHAGKLPKAAMGHNWVLTTPADAQGIAADGIAAGLDKNYLKPGDARVIAFTPIVGGGESTSVTFDTSKLKADQGYMYICSFPGHSALMKGTLKLVK